jgi:hypothetical protein
MIIQLYKNMCILHVGPHKQMQKAHVSVLHALLFELTTEFIDMILCYTNGTNSLLNSVHLIICASTKYVNVLLDTGSETA